MKKKKIFVILLTVCIAVFLFLQYSLSPTINNIHTETTSHGYHAYLTITANKIFIFNQDKLEKQLIQQVLDNDFKNMQMSYDLLGYPEELTITVYTNRITKFFGCPAFQIRYSPETL